MLFRAIYAVTFYCRCCKALSYFFTLNNKNVSECRQEKGEIKKILFLLSFDVLLSFNILHRSSAWCGNICSDSFVTCAVWRASLKFPLINMHARDGIALCHKNISFLWMRCKSAPRTVAGDLQVRCDINQVRARSQLKWKQVRWWLASTTSGLLQW